MTLRQHILMFLLFLSCIVLFDDGISPSTSTRLAGAMLETQNKGIFQSPIFTGYLMASPKVRKQYVKRKKIKKWNNVHNFNFNLHAYKSGLNIPDSEDWKHYTSAIRIQMYIACVLDYSLFRLLGSHNNIKVINFLYGALGSLMLYLFLVWTYREFGSTPTILMGTILLFNQIGFEFGDFYCFWILIMPFIYLCFQFESSKENKLVLNAKNSFTLGLIMCMSIMVTYADTPTMLVSLLVAPIYYAIKNRWSFKYLMSVMFRIGIVAFISFLIVFSIHIVLLTFSFEGLAEALAYLKQRFLMRTYNIGASEQVALTGSRQSALKASLTSVIFAFLESGKGIFGVKEYMIIITIGFLSVCMKSISVFKTISEPIKTKMYGLSAASFVAFLAGLARPIVFKSHAAQTAHQVFIVDSFNIPFKIVAVFTIVYFISVIITLFKTKNSKHLIA